MNSDFTQKLGFHIQKTNVWAQRIDDSILKIFRMLIADFRGKDKFGKLRFFQKTFLVADTKFEVILGMFFLKISNGNMSFGEGTLMWKFYTTNKVLLTTKQVQIVDSKKFIIVALDIDNKTFVMHVAIKKQEEMPVHFEKQAQVGALLFNKAPTEVPMEYSDYCNVFSRENTPELPENIEINEHAIKIEEDKQPFFGPIYNLKSVEFEILKTHIKTILANNFICLSKLPAGTFILFNRKLDGSFRLCVNYWGLNNITIKKPISTASD